MTLPSRHDEEEALKELINRERVSISTAPDISKDLRDMGVPPEVTAGLNPWSGKETTAICMIARSMLIMPDNKIGPCDCCEIIVQWRPTLPKGLEHLCVFCALRRMRGDA